LEVTYKDVFFRLCEDIRKMKAPVYSFWVNYKGPLSPAHSEYSGFEMFAFPGYDKELSSLGYKLRGKTEEGKELWIGKVGKELVSAFVDVSSEGERGCGNYKSAAEVCMAVRKFLDAMGSEVVLVSADCDFSSGEAYVDFSTEVIPDDAEDVLKGFGFKGPRRSRVSLRFRKKVKGGVTLFLTLCRAGAYESFPPNRNRALRLLRLIEQLK